MSSGENIGFTPDFGGSACGGGCVDRSLQIKTSGFKLFHWNSSRSRAFEWRDGAEQGEMQFFYACPHINNIGSWIFTDRHQAWCIGKEQPIDRGEK